MPQQEEMVEKAETAVKEETPENTATEAAFEAWLEGKGPYLAGELRDGAGGGSGEGAGGAGLPGGLRLGGRHGRDPHGRGPVGHRCEPDLPH